MEFWHRKQLHLPGVDHSWIFVVVAFIASVRHFLFSLLTKLFWFGLSHGTHILTNRQTEFPEYRPDLSVGGRSGKKYSGSEYIRHLVKGLKLPLALGNFCMAVPILQTVSEKYQPCSSYLSSYVCQKSPIALYGKLVELRKLGFNPIKYEPMPTASIFCFILSEVNVTPLWRGSTTKTPSIFCFILSEVNVTPLFRGLTHKTPSIFCFILSEVNVTPLFRGLTHKMPWIEARNLAGMHGKWPIISDKKWNTSKTGRVGKTSLF